MKGEGAMVRCRDCEFMGEDYITSLSGRGIYRFSYCQRLVHDCKVVEPDIERECEDFGEREDERNNVNKS